MLCFDIVTKSSSPIMYNSSCTRFRDHYISDDEFMSDFIPLANRAAQGDSPAVPRFICQGLGRHSFYIQPHLNRNNSIMQFPFHCQWRNYYEIMPLRRVAIMELKTINTHPCAYAYALLLHYYPLMLTQH